MTKRHHSHPKTARRGSSRRPPPAIIDVVLLVAKHTAAGSTMTQTPKRHNSPRCSHGMAPDDQQHRLPRLPYDTWRDRSSL